MSYRGGGTTRGPLHFDGTASPGLSVAGEGRIYFDSTSNTFKVSQNGGAYFDLATAGSITLQSSYDNGGGTIALTLADGPIAITNPAATAQPGLTVVQNTAGQFAADFTGDVRVTGKLTVTGDLDPTSVLLSGGTALYFESNDGSTAPVSGAATGRLRYNNSTGRWQVSTQAGAYTDLSTSATSTLQQSYTNGGAGGGAIALTLSGGPIALTAVDGISAVTLTGGTQTTSNPVLNATQTWNAGAVTFTGIKLNVTDTASAAASLLADLQVGGSSVIAVGKAGRLTRYSGVSTAGWGAPAIYASGRSTGQTAAVASVATYTVGAADGSFDVSANLNVTASTTHSISVTVTYTDENSTSRTLRLNLFDLNGVALTTVTQVEGTGPYSSSSFRIRCKSATSITVATTGVFTSVTYNVEATIGQVA